MIEFYVKTIDPDWGKYSSMHTYSYNKLPETMHFLSTQQLQEGDRIYIGGNLYQIETLIHELVPTNPGATGQFRRTMKVIVSHSSADHRAYTSGKVL